MLTRRRLIESSAVVTAAVLLRRAEAAAGRRFTLDLCPSRIGVGAGQAKCIELASQHGFESIEPYGTELAAMPEAEAKRILQLLKSKELVWGAGGLPIQFRESDSKFQADLKRFSEIAEVLRAFGVTRLGTWIMPCHNELTYLQNFKLHRKRLGEVAKVLEANQLRLGLEYVGTKTLRMSKRFTFVHCLAETRELLDAIDSKNVGLVLDSWHWHMAQEKVEDLLSLKAEDVVAVDINDAPKGLAYDEQIDNQRTLPAETGVIDIKAFLNALVQIGYDGPVRAEPFSKALNALDDEPAVAQTGEAMKKAFELIS